MGDLPSWSIPSVVVDDCFPNQANVRIGPDTDRRLALRSPNMDMSAMICSSCWIARSTCPCQASTSWRIAIQRFIGPFVPSEDDMIRNLVQRWDFHGDMEPVMCLVGRCI